jgi:uncharacterized protein YlzI (FlbEa/FlbD family)
MIITLTDSIDGKPLSINADEIQSVRDYPAGQTWVEMKNGAAYQPSESVEEVTKRWNEAIK